MSKYFDKLVQINENLDRELKDRGLVVKEDEDNSVPVPADTLTDDQKKEILIDRDIDKQVVDGMSPEEMDGALKASDDEKQNESLEETDSSDEIYIRIDDDDLEIHGYLSRYSDADEPEWVTDENKAQKFKRSEYQDVVDTICKVAHYDPETITTQDVEGQVKEDENWISLDSMQPGSTTLG